MPISLGDITFGIGPDTTRFRASITDITSFGAAVETAARVTQGAATGATAALMRQEAAAISALQKVQRFQDQVAKTPMAANLSQGFNQLSTEALDRYVARMTAGQLTAIQFQREQERLNQSLSNGQRVLGQYSAAQRAADASSMVASLQQLSAAATLIYGPLSGVATRFSVAASLADHFNISVAGLIVGFAAGGYAFAKFATAAVDVEKKMQNVEQTFVAVTGSQTIAALQIKYLGDFADRAGVKFDDLTKNYGQLEAAAKGTNLEGERTNKVFEGITMAAGKLGLSADDTKGALLAIQQMITKGTVQMEELKSQLGDRMPGALKAFADSLGVTTVKFSEMVKKGEVGASSLVGFVETLKKRYSIDDSTKIDTITAAENRLSNARIRMIDSLDKVVGLSSAYTNVLNYLSGGINGASTRAEELVKVILQVGSALTAAFAGQIVIGGLSMLVTGIINLGAAIVALNVATAAGAFTSFIRLVSVGAVAIAAFYGSRKLIEEMMDGTKQSALNAIPTVDKYIKTMLELQDASNSVRAPTVKYIDEGEKKLASLEAQKAATLAQVKVVSEWSNTLKNAGLTAEQVDKQLTEMFGNLDKSTGLDSTSKKIDATKKSLEDLHAILVQQTVVEAANRDDPIKTLNERQLLTLKGAQDTIRETQAAFDALGKTGNEKVWADTQNEVNKLIENFRDGLSRAQFPLELITKLTLEFGTAMRSLKEGTSVTEASKAVFDAVSKGSEVTKDLEARLKNVYLQPQAKELANAQLDINKNIVQYRTELEKANVPEAMILDLTNKRRTAMDALKKAEINHNYATETTRQIVATKNANDTVSELTKTYDNLYKSPAAKEWAELQNTISKQVENFRDNLSRTELPAATVTKLTDNYAAALKKVKEAELTLSHTTSYFQAVEGIFSRGLDKGLDAWISTVTEGKDAMLALKDTAKAVAADILKTFMTLAALNPIKNYLFGTNYSTLGGTAGTGGAFGNLFGGGGSGGATGSINVGDYAMPTVGFAGGGIMTPDGAKPLKRYAAGGIASGSQYAEFGEGRKPEAYVPLPDGRSIPVSMNGGGGGMGLELHIHEPPGHKADSTQSIGKDGAPRLDVMFRQMARGMISEDIANGGPMSRSLEKQYGLNRSKGIA